MDWGLENYVVDIDYFRVDIIDVARAGPDRGEQVCWVSISRSSRERRSSAHGLLELTTRSVRAAADSGLARVVAILQFNTRE